MTAYVVHFRCTKGGPQSRWGYWRILEVQDPSGLLASHSKNVVREVAKSHLGRESAPRGSIYDLSAEVAALRAQCAALNTANLLSPQE